MGDAIRFLDAGGAGWTMAGLACAAKASGVLACAGALALAIRNRAAATRHLVWALGLAGALAVLPSAVAMPRWGLPVLSASRHEATVHEAPAIEPGSIEPPAAVAVGPPTASRIETTERFETPAQAPRPRPAVDLGAWPMTAWLAGTAAVLAWCAVGRVVVWRIGRGAERITDRRWIDAAAEAAARLGMSRRVTLLRGGPAAMPVTWGTFRAVVLLPAEADAWPDDRRRAVLLHELAHVRRRDGLTQWLGLAACAAYWFNPLAWWAASRLRSEREQACDDLVLEAGERPSDYAAQLLGVARSMRPAPAVIPGAMAMARPSGLEGRLIAILDPRRIRRGPARWLAAAGLAIVLIASATLAAVQLVARETPRPVIAGTIVDADGKPVEGAEVVLLRHRQSNRDAVMTPLAPARLLGRSRTGAGGKFRIEAEADETQAEDVFKLVATAPNAGFAVRDLSNPSDPVDEPIRLKADMPTTVRLIDLEGAPVAGADVRLDSAYPVAGLGALGSQWLTREAFPALLGGWTSDADGRFTIRGVAPGQTLFLVVRAAGFGSQYLQFDMKAGTSAATLSMDRAHTIEGRVTLGKDGPPAVGAKIKSSSMSERYGVGRFLGRDDVTTDADGRYRIEAAPGGSIRLEVRSAGDGADGYLIRGGLVVPGDAVSSHQDFVLPRGVLVKGRVTDAATGLPIAGAAVWHNPYERNNPYYIKDGADYFNHDEQKAVTAADGAFQLAVMPGPGYLLVKGPTADFVHEEISNVELHGQLIWPNARNYPDAFKKVAPKPEESPLDVAFTLRRGATVRGRVVGTDGKPVKEAVLFTRWYLGARDLEIRSNHELPIREGRFELGCCDPDRSAPVFFLDARNQQGAVVELSGKSAGRDLEVDLQPCGTAGVRLVGADGRPVPPGLKPAHLEIILTPGVSFSEAMRKRDESPTTADAFHYSNVDHVRHGDVKTDDDGRMTFPTLIPGATYRVSVFNQPEKTEIEFTVKPGETKDLGDLKITKLDHAG